MEFTGTVTAAEAGRTKTVTITTDDRRTAEILADEWTGKRVRLTLREYHPKRSLDANALFWKLCGELAERLSLSPEYIYKTYIREIPGVRDIVTVRTDTAQRMKRVWEGYGIGWQTETLTEDENGYTGMILYYGSSVYDTKQMKQLIDMVISDCRTQGIPTPADEETEAAIRLWKGRNENK